jgi:hypothetical protein
MQRPQFVRQLSSRIIAARRLNATSIIGLNSARNARPVRKVQYRAATDRNRTLVETLIFSIHFLEVMGKVSSHVPFSKPWNAR